MEGPVHARLLNGEGELVAEGPCWVDEAAGEAALEPEREPGFLRKERGDLALQLESGPSLRVSNRPMIVRIRPRGGEAEGEGRRTIYRLRLIADAQDATAAGAAGEGAPAQPEREAPAAR